MAQLGEDVNGFVGSGLRLGGKKRRKVARVFE